MTTAACPVCQRAGLSAEACTARPKCIICRNITHLPAWGCCAGCVAGIDRMLAELLDLHALANHPAALVPGTNGDHGPGGAHRDPPSPVNIDALDLAVGEHVLGVLEAWERWWREEFKLRPYGAATESLPRPHRPTNATLLHVIGFLRAWWPRAAQVVEPPPDEFAGEVRTLHHQAMTALAIDRYDIDPDAPEPWDWTIRCPRDIDDRGTMCGNRIGMRRRPIPVDGKPPEQLTINCERCGAHWDTSRLLLVAAAAGTRVEISVDDAMAHWGVSRATVYRMVDRGQLQRGAHGRVAIGRQA